LKQSTLACGIVRPLSVTQRVQFRELACFQDRIRLARIAGNFKSSQSLSVDESGFAGVAAKPIPCIYIPANGSAFAFSGRALRDRLVHDFGPTQVKRIKDETPELTPLARQFLSRANDAQKVLWDWWSKQAGC
jgi:hypothetical protein